MARKRDNEGEAERSTEADALHPRRNVELFGHPEGERIFLSAFDAGTLHHAWLLTGEAGIGKASFAYRAARFLLSAGTRRERAESLAVDPAHPVARQIVANAHPSLFILGDGGRAAGASGGIGVEDVRGLKSFLALTTTSGWRVVIVDAVNDLTASSANALLKGVEEPPARTVFFLISQGAAAVLPTIRSRCVRLGFRPLASADFARAVESICRAAGLETPAPPQMEKLHKLSGGAPGNAVSYLTDEMVSAMEKLDGVIAKLPALDRRAMHDAIRAVTGARNAAAFGRFCDLIEKRIEDKARAEAAANRASRAAGWAGLWARFREQRLDLETLNLDKGAFLISAFSDMERVARDAAQP